MQELYWELRYEKWPKIKVRGRFYWWIVRYRGKENIPREVVFGSMAKSLERMNDNMEKALQASVDDPDTNGEELRKVLAAMEKTGELTEEVNELESKSTK